MLHFVQSRTMDTGLLSGNVDLCLRYTPFPCVHYSMLYTTLQKTQGNVTTCVQYVCSYLACNYKHVCVLTRGALTQVSYAIFVCGLLRGVVICIHVYVGTILRCW